MNGHRWFACWACFLLTASFAPVRGEFTFGHLYLTFIEPEACAFGGREVIVEVDPNTGAFNVLADSDDGICVANGMRFTPDGSRLLVLNAGHLAPGDGGWVEAYAPDGSSEIILDTRDGLARPFGVNALAFDAVGDLYIVNSQSSTIMRFPGSAPPGVVFADPQDGILGRGALDFAPNGDLFYCSDIDGTVVSIDPQSQGTLFDEPPSSPYSLVFDRYGNLFVATLGGGIFRYDQADPRTGRLLAAGFLAGAGGTIALTVSPDGDTLYLAEKFRFLYGVDPNDGTAIPIFNLADLGLHLPYPTGIAVYAPHIPGDVSRDGRVDLIDASEFFACVSGPAPAEPLPPQCRPADFDGDRDVDFEDFSRLQILISQSTQRGG